MHSIDFSCKSHILLEDEEGLRVPMSEPYYRVVEIAPGTWRILSDGDYSYLLEGDGEGLLIDSGYGAGNIRNFCEELIKKTVRNIANTHDHFDHTANNCYFDCAYMSAETQPLATLPFPSFEGISFPRDYPVVIVDDGDTLPLKGRNMQVLKITDHAVGSLVFLDRKQRILFSGDELGMPMGKPLNGSVERWAAYMEKLFEHRGDYDEIYGGGGRVQADIVEKYLENAKHILAGNEGVPAAPVKFPDAIGLDGEGQQVWRRRLPHPGDGPKNINADLERRRIMDYAGCKIIYSIDKILESI